MASATLYASRVGADTSEAKVYAPLDKPRLRCDSVGLLRKRVSLLAVTFFRLKGRREKTGEDSAFIWRVCVFPSDFADK